jgi:hypothetical protein
LKNTQFGQKSPCKVWAKEGKVSEGISAIKKKPSLHQDHRKDAVRREGISGIDQTPPIAGSWM